MKARIIIGTVMMILLMSASFTGCASKDLLGKVEQIESDFDKYVDVIDKTIDLLKNILEDYQEQLNQQPSSDTVNQNLIDDNTQLRADINALKAQITVLTKEKTALQAKYLSPGQTK